MNEREPYKIDVERLNIENELNRMVREEADSQLVLSRFFDYQHTDLKRLGYEGQRLRVKVRIMAVELSWYARIRQDNGYVKGYFDYLMQILTEPKPEVPVLPEKKDPPEPDKMGDREPRIPILPRLSGSVAVKLPK